jgi:hypothetical protein
MTHRPHQLEEGDMAVVASKSAMRYQTMDGVSRYVAYSSTGGATTDVATIKAALAAGTTVAIVNGDGSVDIINPNFTPQAFAAADLCTPA